MTAPTRDARTTRVSVLMPVYNAERYLREAIDSILGQTFGDFEFLVHDDGSTDGSLEILHEYARRDDRVIVSAAANRGVTPTLNLLVGKARAPYLARMDSDDIAVSTRFERQVEYLDAHPKCVLVGGRVRLIDPEGRRLMDFQQPIDHLAIDADNLRGNTAIAHPVAMLRASSVREVGGYRAEFRHAEDIDLWLRLAEVGLLTNIDEVLLSYRLHPESIGVSKRGEQIAAQIAATRDAFKRRGLPGDPKSELAAPEGTSAAVDQWSRWGWWALKGGNISTARLYARRVVVARPFDTESWRLLGCALRGR